MLYELKSGSISYANFNENGTTTRKKVIYNKIKLNAECCHPFTGHMFWALRSRDFLTLCNLNENRNVKHNNKTKLSAEYGCSSRHICIKEFSNTALVTIM